MRQKMTGPGEKQRKPATKQQNQSDYDEQRSSISNKRADIASAINRIHGRILAMFALVKKLTKEDFGTSAFLCTYNGTIDVGLPFSR